MSSPSTPAALSPLQTYQIRNLILILRRANAYYSYVAARIRASLQPTRHARRRAQLLGLTINVAAAVKCPQKQVSHIPLPVIELSPAVALAPPPIAAKTRPALRCVIPAPAVLLRTSPNGTTSALSSSSVYSSVTLSSAAPAAVSHARATEDERNEAQWQHLDVPIDEDPIDWGLELQYPDPYPCSPDADVDACDMEMDVSPASTASSDASAAGSNADSSAESTGPVTPAENEMAMGMTMPLTIRIKRKSVEVRGDDHDEMFEKRARVFHNDDEVQPCGHGYAQRRNVIRIPARRFDYLPPRPSLLYVTTTILRTIMPPCTLLSSSTSLVLYNKTLRHTT
ncbi:hypothetical protein LshimejAT787_0309770 [Lyophyllum shimeji]|uniref:Uncharacterized protein n=1 Tax=Lyophyllum shimeji TaxID=47721 RepID=A0A9P3PIB2_LYOSH|nr:hypothetical protein LshimejAT787_0309770 [Lyophyllum shimeji]